MTTRTYTPRQSEIERRWFVVDASGQTLGELLERRPEEVVRRAVRGMLPRNRLGAQQLRKLKVYASATHPHEAQQPEPEPVPRAGGPEI